MDMGLASTDFMMPNEVEVDESVFHGIRCWVSHIDELFGKIIPGQVFAVSGEEGSGKTTFLFGLLSMIADGVPDGITVYEDEGVDVDYKDCAYISAEERIDFLKMKADRLGVSNIALANKSCVEDIAEVIESGRFDVVVVDSIQSLYSDRVDGEAKTLKYATNKLIQAAKNSSTVLFIVAHSTVSGRIKGGTKLPHQVDCTMRINKAGGDRRCIFTQKNRMGREGEVYLNMLANGYDYHNPAPPTSDEDEEGGNSGRVSNDDVKEAIRETIENDDDGVMNFKELASLCKEEDIDIGRAERVLREMVAVGDVVRTGTRRHNFRWTMGE